MNWTEIFEVWKFSVVLGFLFVAAFVTVMVLIAAGIIVASYLIEGLISLTGGTI